MRRVSFLAVLLLFSTFVFAEQLTGDYVETRNADVYTGQCFANGEMGLMGDQAILGWHIQKGSWHGVALDGLNVVAVVKARATLGDPYGNPYPAKSVLVVDDQATPQQREALVAFAHHMAGDLVAHVVRVEAAPMEIAVPRHGVAMLRAGRTATVRTRLLNSADHVCGNEVTYYPPLTTVSHAMPAVAVTDEYSGSDLGARWETHGKRSAFVGTFVTSSTVPDATLAQVSQSGGR